MSPDWSPFRLECLGREVGTSEFPTLRLGLGDQKQLCEGWYDVPFIIVAPREILLDGTHPVLEGRFDAGP